MLFFYSNSDERAFSTCWSQQLILICARAVLMYARGLALVVAPSGTKEGTLLPFRVIEQYQYFVLTIKIHIDACISVGSNLICTNARGLTQSVPMLAPFSNGNRPIKIMFLSITFFCERWHSGRLKCVIVARPQTIDEPRALYIEYPSAATCYCSMSHSLLWHIRCVLHVWCDN